MRVIRGIPFVSEQPELKFTVDLSDVPLNGLSSSDLWNMMVAILNMLSVNEADALDKHPVYVLQELQNQLAVRLAGYDADVIISVSVEDRTGQMVSVYNV